MLMALRLSTFLSRASGRATHTARTTSVKARRKPGDWAGRAGGRERNNHIVVECMYGNAINWIYPLHSCSRGNNGWGQVSNYYKKGNTRTDVESDYATEDETHITSQ